MQMCNLYCIHPLLRESQRMQPLRNTHLLKQDIPELMKAPYMNGKLIKETMKRSRLRNKFLNTKSDLDRKAYNKQRNYVVSLLRKEILW